MFVKKERLLLLDMQLARVEAVALEEHILRIQDQIQKLEEMEDVTTKLILA